MGHWSDELVLPEGWIDRRGHAVEDARSRDRLDAELHRELRRGHVLWPDEERLGWKIAAQRVAQDDVLLVLDDGRMAFVHLTWSGRAEPPPWPTTTIVNDSSTVTDELVLRE